MARKQMSEKLGWACHHGQITEKKWQTIEMWLFQQTGAMAKAVLRETKIRYISAVVD